MDPLIEQVSGQDRVRWLVHACGMTFTFSDLTSAERFAVRLKERVNAPHPLPEETIRHWAAEHFRMLRGS